MIKRWWRRWVWKHRPYVLVSTESESSYPYGTEPSKTVYEPIKMYAGDITDITWKIEVMYDPDRRIVKIFSQDKHIGSLAAEDGYQTKHSMNIDFTMWKEVI